MKLKKLFRIWQENKEMYLNLAFNDFKARYTGSYLGIIWGFVQPMVTVLIYWFVFQFGLRSGDRPDGTPYILWLICGMILWFFFSDVIGSTVNSFIEYSYLVKKVSLRIGMLPLIKIGSSLIIHSFFLVLTTVILNFYGYQADWNYLQILYYLGAAIFLGVGLALLTSSLSVFFRDTSQIVAIFIQVGFWAIPIVWGPEILGRKLRIFFELNPVYYLIQGYRDTFLTKTPFWDHPLLTLYYWIFSIVTVYVGYRVFEKLKPNFADVL